MKILQICLITLFSIAMPFAGNWNVDPAKAKVAFTVRGPFGTVNGTFTGLKATINFDEKNPAAGSISATIDPKTVSTGIGMRNTHLRTKEEWFDTEKYPEISFKSSKIEKADKGFKAEGNLTMKGVSKPVVIPFTFTGEGSTGVFKGQFTLDREAFKLGKSGGSVGKEVTVTLEVPVKK